MMLDYTLAILVLSFTGASWSYFIEYLFMPSQLLAGYGLWINQWAGNAPLKTMDGADYAVEGRGYKNARWWAFPLGACTMCMNVYVTLVISVIALLWLGLTLWLLIPILSISSYWLRKVMS
jgi:hypothetical protein